MSDSATSRPDRWSLPVCDATSERNIPAAQRFLRDGGLCSCFYRLEDGTPVICAMPTGTPHHHRLSVSSVIHMTETAPLASPDCPYRNDHDDPPHPGAVCACGHVAGAEPQP